MSCNNMDEVLYGGIRLKLFNNIYRLFNICSATLLLLLLVTSLSFASSAEKRILSLVDYIGGDYQNAVNNGEVINEDEYNEMLEFSAETKELFKTLKLSDKTDEYIKTPSESKYRIQG